MTILITSYLMSSRSELDSDSSFTLIEKTNKQLGYSCVQSVVVLFNILMVLKLWITSDGVKFEVRFYTREDSMNRLY